MASERVNATAVAYVPHLHRVIEGTSDDALALRIEVKRDDLSCVTQQSVQTLSSLDIPHSGSVVHGASGQHRAVGIKRDANDLCGVTSVGVM